MVSGAHEGDAAGDVAHEAPRQGRRAQASGQVPAQGTSSDAELTELRREVAALRRAAEANDLLASASAAFDTSLDPLQTMRTVANSAVPRLADLCVIDLVREDGTIGDTVVAAVDDSITLRLEELRARQPLDVAGGHPVAVALRSGEPVWVHDLTDPRALERVAQSDEHMRFMLAAGYRSAVVIKLMARGRLLGALSFLRTRGERDFEADRLPLMQDLANRAAMALDNANLYVERTRVARTLQRSLLPDALPRVEGVQLASAYHPAGEGGEVGGDFYDVFEAGDGCWLVVGDVCGKGNEAAAVTSLVRHSIRALAFQEDSPARVLHGVNEVMLSHELFGRFATAIVARIDFSQSPLHVTIASAGHPAPVLLEGSGKAYCPQVAGTLLGVLAQIDLGEVGVWLEPGSSLVLFTDGLTDAGAPRSEIGPDDLCRQLVGSVPSSPEEIVESLEGLATACSEGRLRDDIAILVARVEPRA
jgi:serine phosphatase RsbU (regulator of sigma subunit)